MSRLHFEPGASATHYRFRCKANPNLAGSDAINRRLVASTITRWGNDYPYSGFWQYHEWLRSASPPNPSPVVTRRAYLLSPAFGINVGPFDVVNESILVVRDAEMTATPCVEGVLEFSDLEWYIDGVLRWSMVGSGGFGPGPFSSLVLGYDQAENQTRIQALEELNPAFTHLNFGCEPEPAVAQEYHTYGSAEGGWQWWDAGTGSWIAEPVTIDNLALPSTTWPSGCPGGPCTCTTTLPDVTETDSWNVEVHAETYYSVGVGGPFALVCTCPDASTVSRDRYRYTVEYRVKSSWVDAISQNDSSLYTSRRYRRAGCGCRYPIASADYTIIETETTDSIAYAAHARFVERSVLILDCAYGMILCQQPPWSPSPPPPQCLLAVPSLCYFEGLVMQRPVYECNDGSDQPYNLLTSLGVYLACYVDGSGNVKVVRSEYTIPRRDMPRATLTTSNDCSHPKLVEHLQSGQIWCVFASGGAIRYCTSGSGGRTWSESTLLSNFSGSPLYPDVFEGLDGSIVILAFKYNSGSSGPGKIFFIRKAAGDLAFSAEAALKDDAGADLVFSDTTFHVVRSRESANRPMLVCRINGEADISHWWSGNEFKNWIRGT